jgi:hypothetical protein
LIEKMVAAGEPVPKVKFVENPEELMKSLGVEAPRRSEEDPN